MTVESWNPNAEAVVLTDAGVARLLAAAARLDDERFGLDAEAAGELAAFARHDPAGGVDWAAAAKSLSDDDAVALIRLFTLAERTLSGWEAADASPVVPLARELRARGSYPAQLTPWIRANSDNRFLPYGSLMDRL